MGGGKPDGAEASRSVGGSERRSAGGAHLHHGSRQGNGLCTVGTVEE
jgi:hypothetical protein